MLRYHRPGFDDVPREERAALLADACAYLNESLEGLKKFMAFVEYGTPGKGPAPAARSVARDIRAAVLKDVEDLTYREIGERLGVPPPADVGIKGDYPAVRKMVGRGRRFLEMGLGEEGRRGHVESMRAEAERRRSLSPTQREAEDVAEALGIPYEEALRLVEEERDRERERGREPGIA